MSFQSMSFRGFIKPGDQFVNTKRLISLDEAWKFLGKIL